MNSEQDLLEMISIVKGNIVSVQADAIVNSTDPSFSAAGGIDAAIQKAAGKNLVQLLRSGEKLEDGLARITPAFDIQSAKWIIHTVGPRWKNGFSREEATLAGCYHRSLKLALENQCACIAFPCISVGSKGFPEERAAEIAVRSVYNMLSAVETGSLSRVIFVCSSEKQEGYYKKHLKKLIIDRFLSHHSPESYHDFPTAKYYYTYMLLLAQLEWGAVSEYQKYCGNFTNASCYGVPETLTQYDKYALGMDSWDYNTCLTYIIYLQRSAYWSGGYEAPHYDQWGNGTVRKVLLRMRALLN